MGVSKKEGGGQLGRGGGRFVGLVIEQKKKKGGGIARQVRKNEDQMQNREFRTTNSSI